MLANEPSLQMSVRIHASFTSQSTCLYYRLLFINLVVGAGVVICLEQGADLHMVQLISLLLTVSCSSKIQIGFTFLVLAHPGSPGQRAVKWVCVCYYN